MTEFAPSRGYNPSVMYLALGVHRERARYLRAPFVVEKIGGLPRQPHQSRQTHPREDPGRCPHAAPRAVDLRALLVDGEVAELPYQNFRTRRNRRQPRRRRALPLAVVVRVVEVTELPRQLRRPHHREWRAHRQFAPLSSVFIV